MPVVQNDILFSDIQMKSASALQKMKKELVSVPFYRDFSYRLCWSSNAIEGNTLSLDETISLVEYDEVKSGHTYTEYEEAKNLYGAIHKLLSVESKNITEKWVTEANAMIIGMPGEYRRKDLYIGTVIEASYYPPSYKEVPILMEKFLGMSNFQCSDYKDAIQEIAKQHIMFERIHPFIDGNGRTGRLLFNQQLINQGLLPITIENQSKYRQAFRQYDRNGDISLMVHLFCKGELAAIQRVEAFDEKLKKKMVRKTTL